MNLQEIKNSTSKSLSVFVDGKRVNVSDFLEEVPTQIIEEEKEIKVFFVTE